MPKVVPEYKEEAKARILNKATEMFIEKGFKNTKMTEIANALGVSKGALYQYFKSKDELLIEVVKGGDRFRKSSVFSTMTTEELPLLASRDYFDKMIKSTAQIDKLGVEIANMALNNPELMKGVRGFYMDEVNIVQEFFEEMMEKKLVKPETDTRIVAVSILSFRSGLRGFMSTEESQDTIYKVWNQQVQLLLDKILA